MSADADQWWRNRREASANPGDAWSGGGGAYRRWAGAGCAPARLAAAPAPQNAAANAVEREAPPAPEPACVERIADARAAERTRRPVSRAPRSTRARAPLSAARPVRSVAGILLLIFVGVPAAWFGGRWRLRAVLGSAALGLVVVVFLVPLAWAGRADPCAAAEAAFVDEAVGRGSRFEASKARVSNWAGADGKLLSRGRVGRQIAAEEHAGWPPPLGCTALFWRVRSEGASFGGFTAVLTRALSVRR